MCAEAAIICNGLMVVRLPKWNGGLLVSGRDPVDPPQIRELEYWGVQRRPWEEIDREFYSSHSLPPSVAQMRRVIDASSADTTGLELCVSLDDAVTMLRYSNRAKAFNELIAVHADWLRDLKGEMLIDRGTIEWLGYDIVASGSWSLIADGAFRRPVLFEGWVERLNRFGLLSDPTDWLTYATFYQTVAAQGPVEPVPEDYPIGPLRIGRYLAP